MGTTADKLNYIIATKEAIRKTIEAKGVYLPEDATFRSYADAIAYMPSDGDDSVKAAKAVNFMDESGQVIHSYTAEEAAALSAEPTCALREGLLFKGWNYNLAEVKAYAGKYGGVDVGANYVPNGRKTKLYISITDEADLTVEYIKVHIFKNSNSYSVGYITVDWGDGTPIDETQQPEWMKHTYEKLGDYVITLTPKAGYKLRIGYTRLFYGGPRDQRALLRKVEFGDDTNFYLYSNQSLALQGCPNLEYVSILSKDITSIPQKLCYNCAGLKAVALPEWVRQIEAHAFYGCTSLQRISFNNVSSLGDNNFNGSSALETILIPKEMASITGFSNCTALKKITILQSDTDPGVGRSVIGFSGCTALEAIEFPQGVTYINGFIGCSALARATFPSTLTYLGGFQNCTALKIMDFRAAASVPTLNADFYGLPSDCRVVIPDELYDSWKTQSKWNSSYAKDKFVKASEYAE